MIRVTKPSPDQGDTLFPTTSLVVRALTVPEISEAIQFVDDVLGDSRQGAWARQVLTCIHESSNGLAMAAFDRRDARRMVALGSLHESMHDFSHLGLNITAVRAGFEHSEELRCLARMLVEHAETLRPLPANALEPVHSKEVLAIKFLAMSTGTEFPELFAPLGFQTVHSHSVQNDRRIHWMLRVTPAQDIEYTQLDRSTYTVGPAATEGSIELATNEQLQQAAAVVSQEWGDQASTQFLKECAELRAMPGSAVYGLVEDGRIVSVGAIIKALHHDEAWSRAWIVTDSNRRGQGHAGRLIQRLLLHAEENHARFSDGMLVMEGFSYIAEYYARFGTLKVARCNRASTDGLHGTWTMRITEPTRPYRSS